MAFRREGKQMAMVFSVENPRAVRIAASLRNMDDAKLGTILLWLSKVTRYFSAINTQYNPIFGPYNFMRDGSHSWLAMQSGKLKGKQGEVFKTAWNSLRPIYRFEMERNSKGDGYKAKVDPKFAAEYDAFLEAGGATGHSQSFMEPEDRLQETQDRIDKKGLWNKAYAKPLKAWVESYNTMFENALRFGAFQAAKKMGMTDVEAVQQAKDVTVDFNTKGVMGSQFGALYSFFNSSVQGTERIWNALSESNGKGGRKVSKYGMNVIGGFAAIGAVQAIVLWMAGFGPDEPKDEILQKNIVIPLGGKRHLDIPYPLGFNVIPSIARSLVQGILYQDLSRKRMGSMFFTLVDAVNPVGGNSSLAQAASPTFLDPIIQLAENDSNGNQIFRKDLDSSNQQPGFKNHKESTSAASIWIAKAINTITGGNDGKRGVFSPPPDAISFAAGQATGGPGRLAGQIWNGVRRALSPTDEVTARDVPLVSRMLRNEDTPDKHWSRFSENMTHMNELENQIKTKAKKRYELMESNPEVRLIDMSNETDTAIKKLQKNKREIKERDGSPLAIKNIEELITRKQKIFNDRFEALRQEK